MLRTALIALFTGSVLIGRASHMSGGEIYWDCAGPNQYKITMVIYRDCFGIDVDPYYNLQVQSPCGNTSLLVHMEEGVELSQLCDIQLPNSTCNGGTLPGIQRYTYSGLITLAPCASWTISYTNIYRNAAIVNLVNPGQQRTYIKAVINTLAAPCNDSPRFTNVAIPFVCLGYPMGYSFGAYDVESDSLSYTLIDAMGLLGAPLAYVPPYTGQEPIPGLTIDPVTGQVQFTLNLIGNWVVVVRVDQYVNGVWTGSIMRDMQFVAYPCDNQPPDPSTGLVEELMGGAVLTGPRAIEVCPANGFCFEATIADPNTNNVLTAFSNVTLSLPGATFSYSGSNPITAMVCWPGQAGISGVFPFIITANDGACPIPAIQTYVYAVTVLSGMTATLEVIDESCLGNADGVITAVVSGGSGPYSFTWNNGSSEASITGGPGDYSVTIEDAAGCALPPMSATIGTQGLPNAAMAGENDQACAGVAIQLNGTVVNATGGQWSGGQGSFTGSGPVVSYTPSLEDAAQGGAWLVLTTTGNDACPAASDSLWIDVPHLLGDASVTTNPPSCHDALDGSATVFASNGITYQWNDPQGQQASTATGLGAGVWQVTVTDEIGCTVTLSADLEAPAPLTIEAISTMPAGCVDDGSATVQVAGGTAPYQFIWSNGSEASTLIATAGDYSVQVSDANGCGPVAADVTIEHFGTPVLADAGPDLVICPGMTAVQLDGQVVNATDGYWSGGSGSFLGTGMNVIYTPSPEEIAAGGVDLVLTAVGDTSCPPHHDTVHIAISNSFIQAALLANDITCHGSVDGTITFTPAQPGMVYQWDDPQAQTTAIAMGLDAGTYTVLVTDALGCDSTMSATIIEPEALTIALVQLTPVTCAGGQDGSAEVFASGGSGASNITWSDGQSGAFASALASGTVAVTAVDAHGCSATLEILVQAPEPITLAVEVPDTVCVGAAVQLNAVASGGNGGHVITWAGLGTGSPIEAGFSTSQTITVSVMDALGCSGPSLQVPIAVLDLPSATLLTHGDTTVCPGGMATVSAMVIGYPAPYALQWSISDLSGPGPHALVVDQSMQIGVTASNVCGHQLNGLIALAIDAPPPITLPMLIAEGCAPMTVTMPTAGAPAGTLLHWNFGNGTQAFTPTPTITFGAGTWTVTLTATSPLGCSASASASGAVVAHQPPTAAFTADPWHTDMGSPTIQFTDMSTGQIAQWAWDFGDGGTSNAQHPAHTYGWAAMHAVELWVSDVHGCVDATSLAVTVDPVHEVVIPNVFTPDPNGSGGGAYDPYDLSNDVFYPFAKDVADFRMRIFNRWGELVFESDELKRGWDGWYRGQLCPQDVYVVRAWFRFTDGKELVRTTDLTLLR
ncbi:MAG: gliding motility-associated C-terminal domain-containing protein [Flavobacteriales bacterium]|nr:gliding motility-associated C-terminal domain-containing protein [Flavobacteriales bacterium]